VTHSLFLYGVWDNTTHNLLGEFKTREEAEAFVNGIKPLGRYGPEGHDLEVMCGEDASPGHEPDCACFDCLIAPVMEENRKLRAALQRIADWQDRDWLSSTPDGYAREVLTRV
jgi:hypothetical protein